MVSPVPTTPISGVDLSGFGMPGYTGPGSSDYSGGSSGNDFSDILGLSLDKLTFAAGAQQAQSKLEAQLAAQQQSVQNAFNQQMQQQTQALQLALAQGQINSTQFIAERDRAQREAEFARDYSLKQLEFQHQQRMDEAGLAANPRDFVASQYYLRNLGNPQQMGVGGAGAGGGAGAAGGFGAGGGSGAYDTNALNGLVSAFATGQGQQPLYNPRMGGQGAFGVNVPSPNMISRANWNGMDDTSKGILDSFVRAGVNNGSGQTVALDPAAYEKQIQQSFVPALDPGYNYGIGRTTYS